MNEISGIYTHVFVNNNKKMKWINLQLFVSLFLQHLSPFDYWHTFVLVHIAYYYHYYYILSKILLRIHLSKRKCKEQKQFIIEQSKKKKKIRKKIEPVSMINIYREKNKKKNNLFDNFYWSIYSITLICSATNHNKATTKKMIRNWLPSNHIKTVFFFFSFQYFIIS